MLEPLLEPPVSLLSCKDIPSARRLNSNLFLSLREIVLFWDMDDVIPTIVTTFSLQKFIGCNGALSSKVIQYETT